MFQRVITYLAAAIALSASVCTTSAIASDFGPAPANFESAAEAYVTKRLSDPFAAQMRAVSDPYQVLVDLVGHDDLPCWAVDMRVKARLPAGDMSRAVPVTVLFYNGKPIALKEDAQHFARLGSGDRVAELN